ncbi:phospholipase D-like domain-containing protein [Azorhizobium sp. AG788]|uniref:phospholipase D-like domain-containing protein n=1 Tax=Azorhizobium sp. AG788 TaxID=2183897 RepID=UPI00313904BD
MAKIVSARAYANNEVAFIAWDVDELIPGCLGFDVTRIYLKADGTVEESVRCATWVGFKGQSNPHWIPEDTSIWPVQKLSWRDLTLRKKRNGASRRPDEVRVRYEIRALGNWKPGLDRAPDPTPRRVKVAELDSQKKPIKLANGKIKMIEVDAYEGRPRPLGYLTEAVRTNDITITSRRGAFRSTFTNGILAAQWMRNVLLADGVLKPDELIDKLSDPNDPHRKYLAGDVLPLLHELFARPGEFYLALYELEDEELLELLVENAARIHVILANTSAIEGVWDKRNASARQALVAAGVDLQHRMFNNATHIGHNKFVVHVPPNGGTRAVFTGSTNWTSTGVAGQTNNALLIENDDAAEAFLAYWKRLKADALDVPVPFGIPMKDAQQSPTLRRENKIPATVPLSGGASLTAWFSPNMAKRSKGKERPPDLSEVYRRMRMAKHAILFLAFYPGQKGKDCIIGEAIDIGLKDRKLIVAGAVSSPNAMPNYVPKDKKDRANLKDDLPAISPHTFKDANVEIIRASRIDDRSLLKDFGAEKLSAKAVGAIIHDKILVIDPLSANCTVVLGSHNLGFKASYSNDENMVIISGDRGLAEGYSVHVLDVYDHYRFRAVEAERKRLRQQGWGGFLETDDSWLATYANGEKGGLGRYFANPPQD